jgi:hypothetical protein
MRRELKDIILNFWKNNVPENQLDLEKFIAKSISTLNKTY